MVDTSQERMFTMARARREFTPEYKDEAVKLVCFGPPVPGLSRDCGERGLRGSGQHFESAFCFGKVAGDGGGEHYLHRRGDHPYSDQLVEVLASQFHDMNDSVDAPLKRLVLRFVH